MKKVIFICLVLFVGVLAMGFTEPSEDIDVEKIKIEVTDAETGAITNISGISDVSLANEVLAIYTYRDGMEFVEAIETTDSYINVYKLSNGNTLKYTFSKEILENMVSHRRCTECTNCVQTCYYDNGLVVTMECGGRACEDMK